ncbi:probable inactive serine/threonine-protein kinase fnkC [Momordica charantia]|uniref:Probable inactive serine/threonine-protein kinase fnkC n=1 Tax=Momordica charantia TaxID=3673 RepID=A0A6J1CX47_MOMCH|nr:probable inactive serine/threonine-protein kinase fnkC [Momordica charantia]
MGSCCAVVIRSTRDEKPLHYTLQIQSFSLLKAALASSNRDRYESQIFNAGGYKWKLAVYPNGDVKRNGADHISLYLVKADDDINPCSHGKVRRFHAMKAEWGFEKLISLDTFNDSSNGFVVGDCCGFGVDVVVMKCDGKGEVVSFIKEPKSHKYTWKTKNFSQLDKKFYESDPFTVEGYRWKLWLYPKGSSKAKTGFLSLYLSYNSYEEIPQGSQVYVEYEDSHNCWFGFGGVESGRGWGHPNFLSLRDLNEPTEGFIVDDTIIVEVKINVVSTLKKIVEGKYFSLRS